MTSEQIDRLIKSRAKLTNRRDAWTDWKRVTTIDKKLATVTAGTRNDVDLLLGRTCATLPQLSAAAVADLQARCAETETEPPAYDGMWI